MKQLALSTLRARAAQSTAARGHSLQWHEPYGRPPVPHLENFSQSAHCRHCGMGVTVTQRPAPNKIGIGGEAVALNCASEAHAKRLEARAARLSSLRLIDPRAPQYALADSLREQARAIRQSLAPEPATV